MADVFAPTVQAPLTLMQAALGPLVAWQWLYGAGYALLWLGLVVWWSRKAFVRFVVIKEGVKA